MSTGHKLLVDEYRLMRSTVYRLLPGGESGWQQRASHNGPAWRDCGCMRVWLLSVRGCLPWGDAWERPPAHMYVSACKETARPAAGSRCTPVEALLLQHSSISCSPTFNLALLPAAQPSNSDLVPLLAQARMRWRCRQLGLSTLLCKPAAAPLQSFLCLDPPMHTRCAFSLALLVLLTGLASGAAAAATRARTGSEWLQLLSDATQNGCSGEATVALASDVAVSQAAVDALGLALPLNVPSGCTLRLMGGAGACADGMPHLGTRAEAGAPACEYRLPRILTPQPPPPSSSSSWPMAFSPALFCQLDGLPPCSPTDRLAGFPFSSFSSSRQQQPALLHASADGPRLPPSLFPAAGGNNLTTIDFGTLDNAIMAQPLLFLQGNSTLILQGLQVLGAAAPAVGAGGCAAAVAGSTPKARHLSGSGDLGCCCTGCR